MLCLSSHWHRHGNVADAFKSALGLALTLATFVLVVVVARFN